MTLDSQLSEYFNETDAIRRGIDPETQRKTTLLDDCPPDKAFWLCSGARLSNLRELHDSIVTMDENVFRNHANRQKNDFSDWIREVLGDAKLANSLRRSRTRKGTAQKIARRIRELR